MKNDQILSLISEFCRQADMAELTFGRRAVNEQGKYQDCAAHQVPVNGGRE